MVAARRSWNDGSNHRRLPEHEYSWKECLAARINWRAPAQFRSAHPPRYHHNRNAAHRSPPLLRSHRWSGYAWYHHAHYIADAAYRLWQARNTHLCGTELDGD